MYRVLVGKPEGRRPIGNPGIDRRIILKLIFKKWDVGLGQAGNGSLCTFFIVCIDKSHNRTTTQIILFCLIHLWLG